VSRGLPEIPGVQLRANVSGASVTTMAVGGELEIVAEPEDPTALIALLRELRLNQMPWRVLGSGSNLVIADGGVRGCVIRLGRGFRGVVSLTDACFEIGAGASLMSIARDLSQLGFSGLEFAGGIPASIGGAVYMNAGAHGSEMVNVLRSVTILDCEGAQHTLTPSELKFSYRHSGIPDSTIVIGAQIALVSSDASATTQRRAAYLAERKLRQPLSLPSCGSVFRNPSPEVSAGSILEQAKMKGHWHGGAQVSELHANWIVNPKRSATAADVCALVTECQQRALELYGLELMPEVKLW